MIGSKTAAELANLCNLPCVVFGVRFERLVRFGGHDRDFAGFIYGDRRCSSRTMIDGNESVQGKFIGEQIIDNILK